MDDSYDIVGAGEALEKEILAANKSNSKIKQLGLFITGTNTVDIYPSDQPKNWRLVTPPTETHDSEELILQLQGIIANKELPPYETPPIPFNSARKCFLRQGVSLIGADSLGFESAVESITGIHAAFSRQFKEGQLNNWQPSSSWNQPGIVANNRYLTLAKDTMPHDIIPFSAIEDPKGILNKYVDDTYVHTSDNVVQYYERKLSEGKYRFQTIDPSIFRTGDIVEAQISFVVYPVRDRKFQMLLVLRSLALLNGDFSQLAYLQSMKRTMHPSRFSLRPKRTIGYSKEDDEVALTRQAVAQMSIQQYDVPMNA